jgi:hypothetical protein
VVAKGLVEALEAKLGVSMQVGGRLLLGACWGPAGGLLGALLGASPVQRVRLGPAACDAAASFEAAAGAAGGAAGWMAAWLPLALAPAPRTLSACLAPQVLAEFKGSAIEGCSYRHPLFERTSPVVVGGDYITTESGTGGRRCCPAACRTLRYSLRQIAHRPTSQPSALHRCQGGAAFRNTARRACPLVPAAPDSPPRPLRPSPLHPQAWCTPPQATARRTTRWGSSTGWSC